MEYKDDFIKEFVQRTRILVHQYDGEYDATLLMNCMLGLLVVPKEREFSKVPETPIEKPDNHELTISKRKCTCGAAIPCNTRQLVRALRNAIAHFDIKPIEENKTVVGFQFGNNRGPRIKMTIGYMKEFVFQLADQLYPNDSKTSAPSASLR